MFLPRVVALGLFRAIPSTDVVWGELKTSQGTVLGLHCRSSSRKSSPAAFERRRSFWSFFLGVQEKGRKKRKNKKKEEKGHQRPGAQPIIHLSTNSLPQAGSFRSNRMGPEFAARRKLLPERCGFRHRQHTGRRDQTEPAGERDDRL